MGDQDMRGGGAFASWHRKPKARSRAHSPPEVGRQYVHFKEGSDDRPFDGDPYLKAVQRMKGSAAARKVEPFFWSDVRKIRLLWLCAGCAAEARLAE